MFHTAFEHRITVGELQGIGAEGAQLTCLTIPRSHTLDGLRNLCAVRAHVLHGSGSRGPGNAGQRFQASQALLNAPLNRPLPRMPGLHLDQGATGGRCLHHVDALRGHVHHGPPEAVVRGQDVGTPAHDQDRIAGIVRRGHRVRQVLFGFRLDVTGSGAAHRSGGQVGQSGCIHGDQL